MIKECEQSSPCRRNCQREAMHRPVEKWEESCFPGLSLRRCPACLKAVPRPSVRCLQCWGYLLTEEEAIEEIRVAEKVKEVADKSENIVLARRTSQDVECEVNGELIQMPCVDVQRFRRQSGLVTDEGQEAKRIRSKDPDKAQGTIEQIANIEPCHWNKYWKNTEYLWA